MVNCVTENLEYVSSFDYFGEKTHSQKLENIRKNLLDTTVDAPIKRPEI